MNAPFVRATATIVMASVSLFVVARPARAHIKMSAPADWLTTNSEGDPQKVSPCGVDPSTQPGSTTYTLSNKVTTVHPGDQLTVSWTETVPHDGHFRIALALQSRDELKDPTVTSMNADGTPAAVTISDPPVYPVLADNLFPHKASEVSAGKAYTYTVTIPTSASCTKCTLQLLQFMSEHPADPTFFYHHCADLTIPGAGGGTGGGGTGGGGGAVPMGGHGGAGGARTATGGGPGSGGTPATGGVSGTGGLLATGGASGSGGVPGTGGVSASGGTSGSGGSASTGGSPGSGGASPGASSDGGGCSCQSAPGFAGGLGLVLLALMAARVRRRRA